MKLFKLSILFFVTIISNVQCQPLKKTEPVLNYVVREPKIKSVKPPVIFLLHGIGSNERNLISLADYMPENFLVISVQAPYQLDTDGYAWYHANFSTPTPVYDKVEAEKSRNTIIQFISEVKAKHPFDEKQIYLLGFSQGAIMSYSVGLTRPDLIKGIAIMSGRLLEDVKPMIVVNEPLKQLKIFISHGTNDPVIKVKDAQAAWTYLTSLNLHPTYREYMELHSINDQMLADVKSWLLKK